MEHNHNDGETMPWGACPACDEELALTGKVSASQGAALVIEHLIASGPGPYSKTDYEEMANRYSSSKSSVYRLLAIKERREDLFELVRSGELTIAEGSRQAGFIEYGLGKHDVPTGGFTFGRRHGTDKFWESVSPISRYLRSWKVLDFKFTHVPPREASRRLRKVEDILESLEAVREDLLIRADNQSLSLKQKKGEDVHGCMDWGIRTRRSPDGHR